MAAPLAPWTTRAEMSAKGVEASAARAEAEVNRNTAHRKSLRRPIRSPSAAVGRIKVA